MKRTKRTNRDNLRLWLVTVVVGFGIVLFAFVAVQQALRLGMNDPQLQIAQDTAAKLAQGATPAAVMPSEKVDESKSLATFVTIVDQNTKVLASMRRSTARCRYRQQVPSPTRRSETTIGSPGNMITGFVMRPLSCRLAARTPDMSWWRVRLSQAESTMNRHRGFGRHYFAWHPDRADGDYPPGLAATINQLGRTNEFGVA